MLIILLELGKFPNPLIGQSNSKQNYIQLSRGDEIRSISTGSWVVVIQKDNSQPFIGILRGNVEKNLLIEIPKNNGEELHIVPAGITLFLYLLHGWRQYNLKMIDSMFSAVVNYSH